MLSMRFKIGVFCYFYLIFFQSYVLATIDTKAAQRDFAVAHTVLVQYKDQLRKLFALIGNSITAERVAMQAQIDACQRSGGEAKASAQIAAHDLRDALVSFVGAVKTPITSLGGASMQTDEQSNLLALFNFSNVTNWKTISTLASASQKGGTSGAEALDIEVVKGVFANVQESVALASTAAQATISGLKTKLDNMQSALNEANGKLIALQKEKGKAEETVEVAPSSQSVDQYALARLYTRILNMKEKERKDFISAHRSEITAAENSAKSSAKTSSDRTKIKNFAQALVDHWLSDKEWASIVSLYAQLPKDIKPVE